VGALVALFFMGSCSIFAPPAPGSKHQRQTSGIKYRAGMEGIRATMAGPFDQAVERVKSVLKEHGFGTLSEIDVRRTLKEKIDHDIEPYTILGVCNPGIASRAIATEHEIGVFLPCTILVHECDGKVNVLGQDPLDLIEMTGNDELAPIVREAHDRISKAFASL